MSAGGSTALSVPTGAGAEDNEEEERKAARRGRCGPQFGTVGPGVK